MANQSAWDSALQTLSFILGGFRLEAEGDRIRLQSPEGQVETGLFGFMAGIRHLLRMDLDLEGQAELDGGFVVRVEGERVRLRLGGYAEYFSTVEVSNFFQRLASELPAPV